MWSLGVIVYVLLSGMLPFDAEKSKETARKTIEDPLPMNHNLWRFVSSDAKDLIVRLLDKSPESRIRLEDILTHSWLMRKLPKHFKRSREVALLTHDREAIQNLFCKSTP